jgi:hypothetical protein
MSVTRPRFNLEEADARELLAYVSAGWRPSERLHCLAYYRPSLERIASAETHGERDALVYEAARIFGCTVRSIRKDLRAAEDLRRLEMMAKMPPRPPKNTA